MPVYYLQKFRLTLLLLVFLLTSCLTVEEKVTIKPATPFIKIPQNWSLNGRGSVQVRSELITFSIQWLQTNNDFEIILSSGFLSIFSMVFKKKNNQLTIDDKPIKTTFENWMLKKYGWFLPLHEIPKWIFTHQKSNDNWQVNVASYKNFEFQNNVFKIASKKLKLINKQNNIKIKLIIKKIKN